MTHLALSDTLCHGEEPLVIWGDQVIDDDYQRATTIDPEGRTP